MPDAVYRGRYRGKKYKRKVKALDMPDPMKTSVPRLSMKSGNLLTSKGGDVTEESGRMLDRALMRKSYDQREGIAKGRMVRTPAGAKRYGVPIGTPISAAKAKQKLPPVNIKMTTTEKPPPAAASYGRPGARAARKPDIKRTTAAARRRQAERLADGAIGDLGGRPSSGRKRSSERTARQAAGVRRRTGVPEGLANQTKSPQSGSPIFNTPGAGSRSGRSQRPIGSDLPFNLSDGSPRQQFDESDEDFAFRKDPLSAIKLKPLPKSKKKRRDEDEEISRRLHETLSARLGNNPEPPPLRMR